MAQLRSSCSFLCYTLSERWSIPRTWRCTVWRAERKATFESSFKGIAVAVLTNLRSSFHSMSTVCTYINRYTVHHVMYQPCSRKGGKTAAKRTNRSNGQHLLADLAKGVPVLRPLRSKHRCKPRAVPVLATPVVPPSVIWVCMLVWLLPWGVGLLDGARSVTNSSCEFFCGCHCFCNYFVCNNSSQAHILRSVCTRKGYFVVIRANHIS